jgi:CheY-like chemotaxis protein
MPEGGTLELTAGSLELTAPDPERAPDAEPGSFLRLTVRDTGTGMTDEVRARIFEPFFTTKGPGKGTGLGLAMVHGIVKQHRGWVECVSAPGSGTRIDLYLPAASAEAVAARVVGRGGPADGPLSTIAPWPAGCKPTDRPPDADPTGRTVLLVDDEAMIRDLGRAVLERSGYRVITAVDGVDAVEVFGREHASVDLVILDVTMPRMSGRDAYRHLVEIEPAARVLFSTGYSSEDIAELNGALGLLSKPYRPAELLAAVREVLGAVPAA